MTNSETQIEQSPADVEQVQAAVDSVNPTDPEVAAQVAGEEAAEPKALTPEQQRDADERAMCLDLLTRAEQANGRAIDRGLLSIANCDNAWREFLTSVLERIGDTPENVEYLTQLSAPLQVLTKNTAVNAVKLAEMHNYFINGGLPIDLGAKFVMDDYCRGIHNFAYFVLPSAINVYDPDAIGAADPRWSFDVLPVDRIVADPVNASIPVRIETYDAMIYGHLECFKYQTQTESGQIMTIQTTHPAIRIRNNYITVNSVVRWFESSDDEVKMAWLEQRGFVKKKAPELLGKDEAAGETGTP